MIKAGSIDKGTCLLMKNAPYLVVEREFVNPGKGSAFVRLKLKSLTTGQTLQETIKTNDNVEEAAVADRRAQYMYADATDYHFMDTENYEQFAVPREGMEDKQYYLQENHTYFVTEWEGKVIEIKIPYKIVLEVTEAHEALKGDTVTGATKTVVLETGLSVRVPIFIKQGEKVMINTESNEYVERVNT
ncbi:MAG: elongation factor P [Spirochaetaceae bacterium]|nr:elongation factor P [Spirochaetaceae bacterium]